MDGFEVKRREFLKRLGLISGATIVASSGLTAAVIENFDTTSKKNLLSLEQQEFLSNYETWLSEFKELSIKKGKDSEDIPTNMRIIELSKQAKEWQPQLTQYMQDENFARYFMVMTEETTKVI